MLICAQMVHMQAKLGIIGNHRCMECMDGMLAVSRSRISLLLGFSSVVSIVVLAFQGLHGNLLKCWTLPHCCDNPFVHQLWQIAVFVYDHAPLALLSSQIKLGTLI